MLCEDSARIRFPLGILIHLSCWIGMKISRIRCPWPVANWPGRRVQAKRWVGHGGLEHRNRAPKLNMTRPQGENCLGVRARTLRQPPVLLPA